MIKHYISSKSLVIVVLALAISARGQVDQNTVSRSLIGTTVRSTVQVAYAATDSRKRQFENTQANSTAVKTVISGVRNEGFLLGNGILHIEASTHQSFPIGTTLRIISVIFEKNSIDILLQHEEGGPFGDVRLKLNSGWQAQSSSSLLGLIHKPFAAITASSPSDREEFIAKGPASTKQDVRAEQAANNTFIALPTSDRGSIVAAQTVIGKTSVSIHIPHNYALIFATDTYAHWPKLENPISDADAVNETLTTLFGFSTEEIKNPTSQQILTKLAEYLHKKFQPQDQLLIFFSGHGFFDNDLGQGFLVSSDALSPTQDPGHQHLLAHDTVMHYINRIPSRHVVLVIDACFAGTLDRRIADSNMRGETGEDFYSHATLPELLERKETKRTRRYFASGGKDFVPDGAPGHHSPFVSALLVTLNQNADRKGYVTLDDIQQGLNTVVPEPRWGDIQDDNEPGADFLLLTPTAIRQLSNPD